MVGRSFVVNISVLTVCLSCSLVHDGKITYKRRLLKEHLWLLEEYTLIHSKTRHAYNSENAIIIMYIKKESLDRKTQSVRTDNVCLQTKISDVILQYKSTNWPFHAL